MKLDAYVRVSRVAGREGDSFLSPAQQLDPIRAYAERSGVEIADVVEDLDESGGTMDRPGFNRIISRIENGHVQGIVVARLDRFGRTQLGIFQTVKRIEEAGGKLVSVAENFDLTTPPGRLVFSFMANLAEFDLGKIKVGWADVQKRTNKAGVTTGPVPWGYVKGPERVLVPSPAAPYVTELFERRATGEGLTELVRWLNAERQPTTRGGEWTIQTVRSVLKRRVYLGEARYGDLINAKAHEPLVSISTWLAAQRACPSPARLAEPRGMLRGLVRCAGCRYAVTLSSDSRGHHYYRCNGRHSGGGQCPAPVSVAVHALDAYVMEWVRARVEEERLVVGTAGVDTRALETAVADAQANLDLYLEDLDLRRLLGKERYAEQVGKLTTALADAQRALMAAVASSAPSVDLTGWDDLPVVTRRKILGQGIDVVFLRGRPGRGAKVNLDGRVLILGRGQGPKEIPRRGVATKFGPFPFPDDHETLAV